MAAARILWRLCLYSVPVGSVVPLFYIRRPGRREQSSVVDHIKKTTTSQLIHRLANEAGLFSALSSGRVTDVECLTAGIIPLHVESKVKEVGNMVIYDFAGQQEYYSSHAAVWCFLDSCGHEEEQGQAAQQMQDT